MLNSFKAACNRQNLYCKYSIRDILTIRQSLFQMLHDGDFLSSQNGDRTLISIIVSIGI
jgi:hypothetical protein